MVGAGAGTGLRIAPTGWSCSIRVVSCIVFPPRMEIGKASRRTRSATLPSWLCRFRRRGARPSQTGSSSRSGSLRTERSQAARTNPLVMRSRNQSWSTLRRSMSVGCSRMKRRTSFSWIR